MKKVLVLSIGLIAAMLPAAAQAQDDAKVYHRLIRQFEPEFEQSIDFEYNDRNLVTEINHLSSEDQVRLVYTYDEAGRCLTEVMSENINWGGKYYDTNKLIYTYDEQGRMKTRTFYYRQDATNPVSEFVLTAVTDYFYNDKGLLEEEKVYWDEARNTNCSFTAYTYNDKDQLVTTDVTLFGIGNRVLSSDCLKRTYNDLGQLTEIEKWESDAEKNNILVVRGYDLYTYDELGNMTSMTSVGASKSMDKKESEYICLYDETVPASDCIYPLSTPETVYFRENLETAKSQAVNIEDWARTHSDDFIMAFDWEYQYENIESGIETVGTAPAPALMAARVNGNELRLYGVGSVDNLRIYDLNGRCVMSAPRAGSSVNVSGLAAGTYLLSTSAGVAKFVR